MLSHSLNGRLKNGIVKAKRNSLVHVTGILLFLEKQLYCELLEFQFISTKVESDATINIPWKKITLLLAKLAENQT